MTTKKKAQATATRGVAVLTNVQCKICTSPHRGEIEDVLVMQKLKETLPDGTRPTENWIVDNSKQLWGMQLNRSNIYAHYTKHFRMGSPEEMERRTQGEVTQSLRELIDEHGLEAVQNVLPDVFLETVVGLGYENLKRNPTVTVDQAIKAVDALTRRKHDEAQATLLSQVAAAVGKRRPRVVEAEVVEVDNGGGEAGGGAGEAHSSALVCRPSST